MRRSFRWQLKWPQLPFANGLQIDSVMDPLKGAAAREKMEQKKRRSSSPTTRGLMKRPSTIFHAL